MRQAIIYDPVFLEHGCPDHVENPGRLTAIMDAINGYPWRDLDIIPPQTVNRHALERVHDSGLLDQLEKMCEQGGGWVDVDTYIGHQSCRVAALAVGACFTGWGLLKSGYDSVFALVRPPGHHATVHHSMGFCLVNNLAVLAADLLAQAEVERILVVDWDAHHGNGTQEAFYSDPRVLFFSTHQWPLYPGTGTVEERGSGAGEGYNFNCPMPPGSGDADFAYVFQEILAPLAHAFSPQAVLISAGFDSHSQDPLAQLQLSSAGFGDLAGRVRHLAINSPARGRVLAALEGGYDRAALAASVSAVLRNWEGEAQKPEPVVAAQVNHRVVKLVGKVKSLNPNWF